MVISPFRDPMTSLEPESFEPDGKFHWGRSTLGKKVTDFALANTFHFNLKGIPRELVFLDRKLAGVYTMLVKLDAPTETSKVLKQALQHAL
jgi:hypothetical protein